MGNKQETENINHWSDLAHISEEYDESETGQSIIDRLNSILKLIRVNDKTIIQNLNKKQRVNLINALKLRINSLEK